MSRLKSVDRLLRGRGKICMLGLISQTELGHFSRILQSPGKYRQFFGYGTLNTSQRSAECDIHNPNTT